MGVGRSTGLVVGVVGRGLMVLCCWEEGYCPVEEKVCVGVEELKIVQSGLGIVQPQDWGTWMGFPSPWPLLHTEIELTFS